MSLYYLNGSKNTNFRINTDGLLFKWLEDNKDVHNDEIHITGDTLEDIKEQQPVLLQNESVLIGHLIYNLEYNGGFVFKEILGFEDLIDEISIKHLIGDDLINSNEYDTIMLVRCIENHQEELNDDEHFWRHNDSYWRQIEYIYSFYCTSQLDFDKINHIAIKKAIKML